MTIKQRQNLLAYLGYYTGPIDGDWKNGSQDACRAFQRDRKIAADGFGGPQTDQTLRYAVANDLLKPEIKEEIGNTGCFWNEIEYWTRDEFRCRCGGKYCSGFPAEPNETLVRLVNDLRRQAGKPAHASSGLRCPAWNGLQGGVSNSRHLSGKALDFYIEGVSGNKLLAMAQADKRTNYAYVIEGQYVHVDVK